MNEEKIDISITRRGKKVRNDLLQEMLSEKQPSFPQNEDHECMFEEKTERSVEYSLKKNPVVGPWKDEDEHEDSSPDPDLTYSQTLKPMLTDMTGAMEQRGQMRIRRYDRGDEIVWVVQIDRNRAGFLDKTFANFIAFIRRAFNA
jgi:hypothetical protein